MVQIQSEWPGSFQLVSTTHSQLADITGHGRRGNMEQWDSTAWLGRRESMVCPNGAGSPSFAKLDKPLSRLDLGYYDKYTAKAAGVSMDFYKRDDGGMDGYWNNGDGKLIARCLKLDHHVGTDVCREEGFGLLWSDSWTSHFDCWILDDTNLE